ncbi:MAG: AI-2E family transporter [Nitrospiraceae bacterium]|nr:AI-2E family transporter [Nitrospiraceae bacterium]
MEGIVPKRDSYRVAAWIIAGAALPAVLVLHLLPALIAGCLVYEIVHVLAPLLRITKLSDSRSRLLVVALLASFVVLLIASGTWGIVSCLNSETGSVAGLMQKMAEIVEKSRETLPVWLNAYLPADTESAKETTVQWLQQHARELEYMGKEAGRVVAHILVGMVIGALISLREVDSPQETPPLAAALLDRATKLGNAFRAIVFAQMRISALNTLFAIIYLEVILPVAGIHLPLRKSMIAITFVAGMLPIIGNLISNAVITVVSLGSSLSVALTSLGYLIVVHKAEYFLNARIVGTQIRSRAWEILLAMLVLESAFGISGLIAAPIYYAYLKRELSDRGMV